MNLHRFALLLLLLAATPVPAIDSPPVHLGVPAGAAFTTTGPQRLFVELELPAVAAFTAQRQRRGVATDTRTQRLYAAHLSEQQRQLLPAIQKQVIRVDGQFRVSVNGFRVVATLGQAAALRALPGVRGVRRFALHEPALNASVPWIGAPALWDESDGSGITVAIIDTGIDYTHANFGGSGDPLDFLLNDPLEIEAGTFPTDKVIGGYDFAGPVYDARDDEAVPEPDPDPIDRHGHGSHVAGIVAGKGIGAHLGAGVAPAADLYALKVFSDEGGSTDLVTDAIEMALDPDGDGAMDDRVDVINMSLGATFGDPGDPSATAAANAAENGVIVVASAGNRGDVPYITGSPAVAPGVISVAASLPGNRTLPAVGIEGDDPSVNGRHEAREGLGPVSIVAAPVTASLVAIVSPADDGSGAPTAGKDDMGCHPAINVGALQGQLALVRRGNCSFATKYLNAQAAGAAGIVVYNDGTTPSRMGPQTMTGLDDTDPAITIPGMMISFPSGEALAASLRRGSAVTARLHPSITVPADPALDDTLAGFTSSGPGHGGSSFKPDIAAPGRGIVSAEAGTGFESVALSGTSMAAPHVAGAAALLRQRFPELAPPAIKALLQNSAIDANRDGPGTDTPYDLSRQGNGVLRVDAAVELPMYATPGGVSFGRINNLVPVGETVSVTVVNRGDTGRVLSVYQETGRGVNGVTVTCPDAFTLPAGGQRQVAIRLDADPETMPYDRGSDSQTEVDGWCVFADDEHAIRVGYLAVVDPASLLRVSGKTPEMTNTGPARGFAEMFTLTYEGAPIAPAGEAAVAAFGFRATDYGGFPLMELGFAMQRGWESPSHLTYEMYVDTDEDGREDWVLIIADWSEIGGGAGSLITAQYPLDEDGEPDTEAGFLDWIFSTADFNDQVMVVPFTLIAAGGEAFLPPGDTDFAWRLVVTTREGAQSSQRGFIDLAQTAPGSDDAFWLDAGETTLLPQSPWPALLLYPNNPLGRQFQAIAPAGRTANRARAAAGAASSRN